MYLREYMQESERGRQRALLARLRTPRTSRFRLSPPVRSLPFRTLARWLTVSKGCITVSATSPAKAPAQKVSAAATASSRDCCPLPAPAPAGRSLAADGIVKNVRARTTRKHDALPCRNVRRPCTGGKEVC
jgi:hypothetical protein